MPESINIDSRLKTIADMITGGVVADIGSDHAYLPVWLWQNNKIKKAYAIDISANVINKIKLNLLKYNISEEIIIPVLSDGLPNGFNDVTDVVISGIGGGTISQIINKINADKKDINFILQAANKDEILRGFLYNNGFDIINEIIVEAGKRIYNIINAKFTGIIYKPKLIEIIAGKNIKHAGYLNNIIIRFQRILKGLDAKDKDKYNIKTEFGYYRDIENLIAEIKNL